MDKYKQFDESMKILKSIELELSDLNNNNNTSLSRVMELREEAAKHYKICNEILKGIQENCKQSDES